MKTRQKIYFRIRGREKEIKLNKVPVQMYLKRKSDDNAVNEAK